MLHILNPFSSFLFETSLLLATHLIWAIKRPLWENVKLLPSVAPIHRPLEEMSKM
jgi:hypothetical protein